MLTLVTGTSCSLGALIACTQNKATSGATVAAALRTAAAAAHTAPGPARPAPPESRCARALRTRASATQRVKAYLGTFELVGGGGSGSEEDEGGGGVCNPPEDDAINNTRVAVNNNAKT